MICLSFNCLPPKNLILLRGREHHSKYLQCLKNYWHAKKHEEWSIIKRKDRTRTRNNPDVVVSIWTYQMTINIMLKIEEKMENAWQYGDYKQIIRIYKKRNQIDILELQNMISEIENSLNEFKSRMCSNIVEPRDYHTKWSQTRTNITWY